MSERLAVLKTYKLYIGGKFPRTESGRYYMPNNPNGEALGNICQSSRKDFRNAVVAARKAQAAWAGRSAFNRSQILYRIAEMLEGRKAQFVAEVMNEAALSKKEANQEVEVAIDRWVYYAGWCDKYQQLFSSVNPVASAHFNFSQMEATGVVAAIAPQEQGFLSLCSIAAPIIAGGNSCIILAAEKQPLSAISLAEVLATSDLPGGVMNILTGFVEELATHIGTHKDVNAVCYAGNDAERLKNFQIDGSVNVKRVIHYDVEQWSAKTAQSPYFIKDFQEVKTTWHPIEQIGGASSGY